MAVYAVFEPRMRDDDLLRHAERFVFVRDGFSWAAFIFGPLWMLRHRLWLALAAYIAIFIIVGFAQYVRVLPDGTAGVVAFILALLIGLEAATLRRRKLLWWRWRDAGVVVADNVLAAEQRFFDRWAADAPAPRPASTRTTPPPIPRTTAHAYEPGIIGMFPSPGGTR